MDEYRRFLQSGTPLEASNGNVPKSTILKRGKRSFQVSQKIRKAHKSHHTNADKNITNMIKPSEQNEPQTGNDKNGEPTVQPVRHPEQAEHFFTRHRNNVPPDNQRQMI